MSDTRVMTEEEKRDLGLICLVAVKIVKATEAALDATPTTFNEMAVHACDVANAPRMLSAAIKITGSQLHGTALRDIIESAQNTMEDVL